MSLTWQKGKRLTAFGENTFEYDGRGRRIKKNGVRYYYDFEDKLIASADGMQYFYDHIGVAGFKYNGVYYTYKRDVQNNITGILDNLGNQVVQYVYDAWGNHTVSGSNIELGNKNPFRYRSYFYDTETGLYFLKARYYDPAIGRFLNRDSVAYADPNKRNGLNLYAYCCNNPVNYCDPTGHSIILTCILIGLVAGAAIGGTVSGINAYQSGARGWDVFGAVLTGAVIGGALGAAAGFIGGGALEFLIIPGAGLISSGLMGGAVLVGGSVVSGGALVVAGAGAVASGITIAGAGVIGAIYLFSKGSGPRMGHNQHENGQFADAMRELGNYSRNSPEWKKAHRALEELKKFGEYINDYQELLEFLIDVLGL